MRFAALLLAVLWSFPALAAAELKVRGTQIVYKGKPVYLQGVVMGDPMITREGRPASDYEMVAKDWNANVIRFGIHPSTWREFGRREVMDTLKREIDAAERAGLFVILTWHVIGMPDGYFQQAPRDLPVDAYDSDTATAKDFWRHMARMFGKDGRVVFELWNEPVEGPGTQTDAPSRWAELKPQWETLIALVRKEGARNLLLVTGSRWGYALQGIRDDLISDANTAYAWHLYANTDGDDPDRWEEKLDGLNEVKPVIVTEWGYDARTSAESQKGTPHSFGVPFRERILQEKHLHHLAWCWHPYWTPSILEADWTTPTEYGWFVKETLWRAASPDELVRP